MKNVVGGSVFFPLFVERLEDSSASARGLWLETAFVPVQTGLRCSTSQGPVSRNMGLSQRPIAKTATRSDNGNWITVSVGVAELTICGGGLQTLTLSALQLHTL
jgi:hypothetical protein